MKKSAIAGLALWAVLAAFAGKAHAYVDYPWCIMGDTRGFECVFSNQRPLDLASVDEDIFVAESVGAEIHFERDAARKVIALTLKQRGQVPRADGF